MVKPQKRVPLSYDNEGHDTLLENTQILEKITQSLLLKKVVVKFSNKRKTRFDGKKVIRKLVQVI
jgi:hypothetical protein